MAKQVNITPWFKAIQQVLLYKEYESREEVLKVAQAMARKARDDEKFSDEAAKIYLEAFEKIQELTFEQMMAVKEILKPIDMGEDE